MRWVSLLSGMLPLGKFKKSPAETALSHSQFRGSRYTRIRGALCSIYSNSGRFDLEQVWVVGNRFQGFTQLDRVYTISGLTRHLQEADWPSNDGQMSVRVGQCVDNHEQDYLQAVIDRLHLGGRVRVVRAVQPVTCALVHKRQPANVLLGEVRQVGSVEFAAELSLNDENELLLDHQTGQHVQGMVVVEAARQMFLAVFETGFRNRWPAREYYMVWGGIDLKFLNFLFPLPAEVRCEVCQARLDDPERLEFDVIVEIDQGGRAVARAEISFTAFDVERIGQIEWRRANQAVDAVMAAVPSSHSVPATSSAPSTGEAAIVPTANCEHGALKEAVI